MLTTQNLVIVPLTHEQLKLYKFDQEGLAASLGLNYLEPQQDPSVIGEIQEAIEFWLKGTLENPKDFHWFTNWHIILRAKQIAIGGIGFAGKPDDEGKVMVGYGLDVRYHGRGFASEALRAMIDWAFSQPLVRFIVAETPLSNIPSHRVLEKNGFTQIETKNEQILWKLEKGNTR